MAVRGNAFAAAMGDGGTPPRGPNRRKAALKTGEKLELKVAKAQDEGIKSFKAKKVFDTESPVLRATEVRDTKRKDAITQALEKAKQKYVYSSGNLAHRIKRGRKRPTIQDA